MTRRIRNTIIDNTTGKVLSGTDTSTATSDFVAAAVIAKQVGIEIKPPGSQVQIVQATKYWRPSAAGVITAVRGILRPSATAAASTAAPAGQGVIFRFRQVRANQTSNLISYTISSGSTSLTSATSISFVSTDNIYIDVMQVGATAPGQGLIVYLEYYLG